MFITKVRRGLDFLDKHFARNADKVIISIFVRLYRMRVCYMILFVRMVQRNAIWRSQLLTLKDRPGESIIQYVKKQYSSFCMRIPDNNLGCKTL